MSDSAVTEQIKIIEQATQTAVQTKEAALRFLEEAGIIKKQNGHTPPHHNQNTSTKKK